MAQHDYLRIRRFGVLSVAKMAVIFGFVVGAIMLITSILLGASGVVSSFPVQLGAAIGIMLLAIAIIFCFLWGVVEAFLYNTIARATGLVGIDIEKGAIRRVDPFSYAKITFVFVLIVFILLAFFLSSVLLATLGIEVPASSLPPVSLTVTVFVVALVLYGFVIPYLFASLYNWLAGKIGGVKITLRENVLVKVGAYSYVKIMLALSVVFFIAERVIGTIAGYAFNIAAASPLMVAVAGFFAVVLGSLIINALMALFYNAVAKRYGGIEVDMDKS